jgi:hypothetical protein
MELNGIANITMILQEALETGKIDAAVYGDVSLQLNLLNRYMIAYTDWTRDPYALALGRAPYWHEVREDFTKYPTLQERVQGIKTELE